MTTRRSRRGSGLGRRSVTPRMPLVTLSVLRLRGVRVFAFGLGISLTAGGWDLALRGRSGNWLRGGLLAVSRSCQEHRRSEYDRHGPPECQETLTVLCHNTAPTTPSVGIVWKPSSRLASRAPPIAAMSRWGNRFSAYETVHGGDRGTRTPNLGDANAALSLLSYIPSL